MTIFSSRIKVNSATHDIECVLLFLQLSSFPEVPINDESLVTDRSSAVPSVASVSVGEVVGNAIPLHPSSRRIKFLIEWRDKTIPITLDDSETIGIVRVLIFTLYFPIHLCLQKINKTRIRFIVFLN